MLAGMSRGEEDRCGKVSRSSDSTKIQPLGVLKNKQITVPEIFQHL